MTLTAERPPLETPDAGVIEEARARQRRQRGLAGAAVIAAVTIAAILLTVGGGGGGSRLEGARLPHARHPLRAARLLPAACKANGKVLQGAPSKSLLSILGVLRRSATAADAIPQAFAARGAGRDAFVHYVRRTRVVDGSSYYIYPAIIGGCGGRVRQGMMHLDANIDLGGGAVGATGGGGATAADIERGQDAQTGPPGSGTSATVTMVVPDGVASVTLRYPAGRASGYSPKISPPVTIATKPVNNELVVRVPRSGGGGPIREPTMIWRGANGHIIKTFNGL